MGTAFQLPAAASNEGDVPRSGTVMPLVARYPERSAAQMAPPQARTMSHAGRSLSGYVVYRDLLGWRCAACERRRGRISHDRGIYQESAASFIHGLNRLGLAQGRFGAAQRISVGASGVQSFTGLRRHSTALGMQSYLRAHEAPAAVMPARTSARILTPRRMASSSRHAYPITRPALAGGGLA